MSTRSNIAILLRPEDRNKNFETPWGQTVNANGKKFLYVYCHNDGYPEGVGADLHNMFDDGDYDEALEYILMGDRSTTDLSYWGWRREKCEPYAADTEEEMYQEDYLYIIEEVNGSLKVRQYGDDDDEVDNDTVIGYVHAWWDDNSEDYDLSNPDEVRQDMLDDCCEFIEDVLDIFSCDDYLTIIEETLSDLIEAAK